MEGISDFEQQQVLNGNEEGQNSHDNEVEKSEVVEKVLTPLEKLLLQQDQKLGLISQVGGGGADILPPTPPTIQNDHNVQIQDVQSNKPDNDNEPQVTEAKEELQSPFLNNIINANVNIDPQRFEQEDGQDSNPILQGQPQLHCRYTREELLHIAELTDTSQLPNDLDVNRLRDLQDATVFRSSSSLQFSNSGIGSSNLSSQSNAGAGATQAPPPRVGTSQLR
eukprot:TRINITY_DN55906_c0_g1_i1.p1 TRINITY_DN55906_c0_g1~~TRINITY_DN55906_c0_g1_i1.p1  ORF type:complete len:223 (-),score=33.81 TRINITY_DN55906_c0_g1_i1:46-714(-)